MNIFTAVFFTIAVYEENAFVPRGISVAKTGHREKLDERLRGDALCVCVRVPLPLQGIAHLTGHPVFFAMSLNASLRWVYNLSALEKI